MIKVEKINKKFIKQSKNKKKEEFYADKDISFEAKDNEVLGILGPNGAGKTTLLRMIAGIMTPSGGSITIDNLNYHDNEIEIKKRIAFLTGNTKLYKERWKPILPRWKRSPPKSRTFWDISTLLKS